MTITTRLRPVQNLRLYSTMAEAARLMYMNSTAALPVCEAESGKVVGLITERDIVATVAEGLDPAQITVSQRLQSPRSTGSDPASLDCWYS